jgi:hypothetical protein
LLVSIEFVLLIEDVELHDLKPLVVEPHVELPLGRPVFLDIFGRLNCDSIAGSSRPLFELEGT